MKIAVVLPSLSRSATVTVALNIANGLILSGHAVDIYYFDEIVEQSVPEGCQIFRISFFKKFDFSEYDVIHSHNLRPDLYLAINRSNIRGVCFSTVHNYVKEELKNHYGKIISLIFTQVWKTAWRRFDRIVCLSADAAKYYGKLLPKSRVSYVYNGVSISQTDEIDCGVIEAVDDFKKKGFFVLGTYCKQTKGKGLEQVLYLLSENSKVAAVLIGDGPENKFLKSLAKELGIENRCYFASFLPFAYIYNNYFDAYIIPSRVEGFGIALVEAALCNVNILCSDIAVFHEMFDNSEVSFFKLDDIKGIGEIIEQIKGGVDKRRLAAMRLK